jgi:PLAT/LH2 domain
VRARRRRARDPPHFPGPRARHVGCSTARMSSRFCLGLTLFLAACAADNGGGSLDPEAEARNASALRGVDTSLGGTVDAPASLDPTSTKTGVIRPPIFGDETFASVEDVPLWLIELEVTTANVDDAGTDDPVSLRMRTRDGGTVDLDVGGDDRERGDTQRYIVNPWSVRSIRDIEQLELYKSGDDGWAVSKIALRVNGDANPIFQRTFSSPQWLDNEGGHARNVVFGGPELRAHPGWSLSGHPALIQPPASISGPLLERMIEGAVGDAMREVPRVEFGSEFGRGYVEAERASTNVTSVDLDLEDPNGMFSAIEIDTDFSITWGCVGGNLDFELSKFRTPGMPADYTFATFPQGKFFRSVEDMLLRLRALTKGRPYHCTAAPAVTADGGIVTNIVKTPIERLPVAVQGTVGATTGTLVDQVYLPPTIEDVPVWSIHVETETADVSDANTDDVVDLSLTDGNDYYALLRNADNRERGATERYLVTIPNIHRVRDIKRLDLRLPAHREDGWCVQRVALFVNDEPTPLFEQRFASCRWVDTDGTDQTPLTISSSQLRADSRWSLAGRPNIFTPTPTQLVPSYLRSRLENPLLAMIGNREGMQFENCTGLYCIQIERGSDRSVEVNLKYQQVVSWAADQHLELNFDLEFRCIDGKLKVDARNMLGRGTDTQPLPSFLEHMNGFGDYFENMTLDRRCTNDPRVVDYGNTFLYVGP